MARLNILYLLTPIIIVLASIRIAGPARAAEIVILGVIAYQAVRLIRFPKVSRVAVLYILLCIAIAIIGFGHATITSIFFSIRTVLALSLFHFLFFISSSYSESTDYRKLMLVMWVTYTLGFYSYFWEFSVIFGCFILIFYYQKKLLWLVLAVFLTFIVGQRTPFVALAMYIGYRSCQRFTLINVTAAIVVASAAAIAASYIPVIAESRIVLAIAQLTPHDILEAWKTAIATANTSTYEQFVYDDRSTLTDGGELSAHLRIRKWAKAYTDFDSTAFLFGLGPDYFDKGADSGFIRLFAGYGVIVSTIFMLYLHALSRKLTLIGRALLIVLMICNLFLDIIFSVVIMSFFGVLLSGFKRKCNA